MCIIYIKECPRCGHRWLPPEYPVEGRCDEWKFVFADEQKLELKLREAENRLDPGHPYVLNTHWVVPPCLVCPIVDGLPEQIENLGINRALTEAPDEVLLDMKRDKNIAACPPSPELFKLDLVTRSKRKRSLYSGSKNSIQKKAAIRVPTFFARMWNVVGELEEVETDKPANAAMEIAKFRIREQFRLMMRRQKRPVPKVPPGLIPRRDVSWTSFNPSHPMMRRVRKIKYTLVKVMPEEYEKQRRVKHVGLNERRRKWKWRPSSLRKCRTAIRYEVPLNGALEAIAQNSLERSLQKEFSSPSISSDEAISAALEPEPESKPDTELEAELVRRKDSLLPLSYNDDESDDKFCLYSPSDSSDDEEEGVLAGAQMMVDGNLLPQAIGNHVCSRIGTAQILTGGGHPRSDTPALISPSSSDEERDEDVER
ncbi:hypothetical protein B0O99DRAFT_680666 [Bisporella sp. PMI_857]|nr:hypothetical protein B0O99DRAFT_680666 [Bisporella sp. PMI_857]